jgi:hypothetical protein
LKEQVTGWAVGTGSGLGIRLVGAPWWVVALVMLVTSGAFLVSLHMSYRHVHRLASLAHTVHVKGHGGIEWSGSSSPDERPP